jgi:flagellin-like hook-associated protein FlgL
MQNFKDNLTDANGGGLETKQRAAIQSNKTLLRKSVVGVSAFALNMF